MGQWIAQWNLEEPQPTEEDLKAAWDAMQPTPEQVFNQLKQKKIDELNLICNTTVLGGYKSDALGPENDYDFDYEAQTNLNTMLSAIANGMAVEPLLWKASDVPQPHTFEQFKALYADGLVHKNANISKYWELKAAVISASNAVEIESIAW